MRGEIEQRDRAPAALGQGDAGQVARERIVEAELAAQRHLGSSRPVKILVSEAISNTVSASGVRGSSAASRP